MTRNPQGLAPAPPGLAPAPEQLAFALLGPVITLYLMRLDAHLRYGTRSGGKPLFVSRAGVRIRRLYHEYLSARGQAVPGGDDVLWISRCLVAKAVWSRLPDAALALIALQFPTHSLRDVCAAMLQSVGRASVALGCDDAEMRQPASGLRGFLGSRHPVAQAVAGHFREQGVLLEQHLRSIAGSARRIILVDSGWAGTSQGLLAKAFGQWEWSGMYFGKIPGDSSDPDTLARATGLMFDSSGFDPQRPATAFTVYRHLIEGLFEPRGPSVEHLEAHASLGVWAPGSVPLAGEMPTPTEDPLYCAILAYIREQVPRQALTQIDHGGASVMRELARVLVYPRRDEALALGGLRSSADFGKPEVVPVLCSPGDPEHSEQRIRRALWRQGQIALEYPDPLVQLRQGEQLRPRVSPEEIFRAPPARAAPALPKLRQDKATVAVIVRTVNRPQFLRRALASIGRQTFQDYICVVICDGGDLVAALQEARRAPIDPRRLMVIDNKTSRGMEFASNLAIRSVSSEFLAIHDDDDSWEPGFLQRTVEFLTGERGAPYGGVITMANHISEISTPAGPLIRNRRPYRTTKSVQFMDMACENLFNPIAFLFRRDIFDRLQGFNEALPVLGDWEFNLRFLLEADIGVIGERLANYHVRDLEPEGPFGNSVVASRDRHVEYAHIVRHSLMRAATPSGRSHAVLVALGHMEAERIARDREGSGLWMKGLLGIVRALATPGSAALKRQLNSPWYLVRNPDLRTAAVDPVAHWLRLGAGEGRIPAQDLEALAREMIAERDSEHRLAISRLERQLEALQAQVTGDRAQS